jgi:SAM-dependent methyltransferase
MDAHAMSFPDASFDVAIAGLVGLDDDYDFDAGRPLGAPSILDEIFRVLTPGGHAYISGWLRQDDNEWMAELIRRHLPGCTRRGYAPGTEAGYIDLLRHAGFEGICVTTMEGRYAFQDSAEWMAALRPQWEEELDRIRARPDALLAFETDARELLAGHIGADGRIAYARPAIFLTARTPAER